MLYSDLVSSENPVDSGSIAEFKLLQEWSKEELAIKLQELNKRLRDYKKREIMWNMKKN